MMTRKVRVTAAPAAAEVQPESPMKAVADALKRKAEAESFENWKARQAQGWALSDELLNRLIDLGAEAKRYHAESMSDDGPAGTEATRKWRELRHEMRSAISAASQPRAQQAEQPAEDDTPAICDPRYFEDDVQPAEEARGDCAACGGTGDVSGEYPGVACSACGGSGRALLAAPAAALPMACLNQDHSDCAMFGAAPVAAEGEEIHVHIEGHDVYTATLQPSGMASPRFVVHVKAAAAEAQVSDLPERDRSKPAERQGLFRKFDVRRRDGSDLPGGRHHGCRYFVLDVDHDPHADVALAAYANACEATHPELARDLREKWNVAPQATHSRQAQGGALSDDEIEAIADEHRTQLSTFGAGAYVLDAVGFARAILARAASEPRVEGALSESSADEILANHASRLAFELECCLFDNQRFFDQACAALGAYKADVEKLYPSPPTFMGEPIPAERKERYRNMRQERAAHHPTGGGNAD